MKLTKPTQTELQPYLDIVEQVQALQESQNLLRRKQALLKGEIVGIDQQLSQLEAARPALLESVLTGTQNESALVDQRRTMDMLQAEKSSKEELLTIIEKQISEKAAGGTELNIRVARLKKSAWAAIERQAVEDMPKDVLPYIQHLITVAGATGRDGIGILREMLPVRTHNDWESAREQIWAELGLPG